MKFNVHDHSPIVSFSDAKSVLPFDPGSMVKGLAFKLPNQAYAIVGMRATDRADYKKIADALGIRRTELRAAEPEELVQTLHMIYLRRMPRRCPVVGRNREKAEDKRGTHNRTHAVKTSRLRQSSTLTNRFLSAFFVKFFRLSVISLPFSSRYSTRSATMVAPTPDVSIDTGQEKPRKVYVDGAPTTRKA